MGFIKKRGGYIIGIAAAVAVLALGYFAMIKPSQANGANPNGTAIHIETDERGSEYEVERQLSYLEQLPETDTLVLWRWYEIGERGMFDLAVNIFKKTYPNVKVEMREFEDRSEYETIRDAELPAGKGPDLLLSNSYSFPDIYKVMDADLFCDLNDFIGGDPDFDLGEYKKVVLDGGVYRGKRYAMPLSYVTKMILTTEETLASAEMDIQKLRSFDGLAGEVKKYLDKHSSMELVYDRQFQGLNMFFPWCGLEYMDTEKKTFDLGGDDFRKVMEAYKDIYKQDWELAELPTVISERDTADALINGDSVFGKIVSWHNFAYTYGALSSNGHSPVYFDFPSINGKRGAQTSSIAVVLRASPNKLNAYRFLKILLSEQIQGNPQDVTIVEFPVLESAVDIHAKYRFEDIEQKQYEGRLISISEEKIMREFSALAIDIDYCELTVPRINFIIYTHMEPYFRGEDTYGNCLSKTRNELALYLSE